MALRRKRYFVALTALVGCTHAAIPHLLEILNVNTALGNESQPLMVAMGRSNVGRTPSTSPIHSVPDISSSDPHRLNCCGVRVMR